MSDILIAHILIMLLLVPVILRPFSARLQSVAALALVPLLALGAWFLCALAFSVRLSLIPLFVLIVLLNLANLSRLFRFIRGLPTDWYGPVSSIVHALLIFVFAGVLVMLLIFPAEPARPHQMDVLMQIRRIQLANGLSALVEYSRPEAGTELPLVIVLTAAEGEAFNRPTLRSVLNDAGYAVLSARFDGLRLYRSPLLSVSFLRPFLFYLDRLTGIPVSGVDTGDAVHAKRTELLRLLELAESLGEQHSGIFVFAEGSAAHAVLAALEHNPGFVNGCILFMTGPLPQISIPYRALSWRDGIMLPDAGGNPLLILNASGSDAAGFGEIAADDLFSTRLLAVENDTERKAATLLARRVLTWLELRRVYDYPGI